MSLAHRNDILLSLLVGGLIAVGPLTPNEWLPSAGIGLVSAVAFLAWRIQTRRAAAIAEGLEETEGGEAVAPSAAAADVPWLGLACVAVFIAVFAPTFPWLYEQWTGSVWQNDHGLFVPFIMFLLARTALRRMKDEELVDDASLWGFIPLGLGVGMAVLDVGAGTRYLAVVGMIVALPGLSLLLLGVRRTRAISVPLLLGVFMIPVPTTALNHLFLRNATASGVAPMLGWLGVPHVRDHSVITLSDSVFIVGDACSGFATVYSALALAVFLACYCRSNRRRVALLAAFLPLAIAANIVRVLGLIIMARTLGFSMLDTAAHEASGVASFALIIVALFALADREALREAFHS